MSCESFETLVALHVEGDLEGEDAAPVAAHLAGCAGCRAFAAELRASQEALKGLADVDLGAAAAVVRRRVLAAVDVPGTPRRWCSRRRSRRRC